MTLHTDRHFEDELQHLQQLLLRMGGIVEQQIARAIESLVDRDADIARDVIAHDREVNQLDILIDEECLKVIALHQPAAGDLRFVTTALKVNTDLERIGDMAAHIAERALELDAEAPVEPKAESMIDLPLMANLVRAMLHRALDAFVREDADLALDVCRSDDAVDKLHSQLFRALLTFMGEDPSTIARTMRLLFVSKNLERVGDHATNIAEMVIFLVKGQSIRHMDTPPRRL